MRLPLRLYQEEEELVSKLVFYAQSTITVISGRKKKKKRKEKQQKRKNLSFRTLEKNRKGTRKIKQTRKRMSSCVMRLYLVFLITTPERMSDDP